MTLEYYEDGLPKQDGYYIIYLVDSSEQQYSFNEVEAEPQNWGMFLSDIEHKEWNLLIPWQRIYKVRQISNSQEYQDALDLFRMNCDHNYIHASHHPLAPCENRCTKCGISEPAKEEHIHSDSE